MEIDEVTVTAVQQRLDRLAQTFKESFERETGEPFAIHSNPRQLVWESFVLTSIASLDLRLDIVTEEVASLITTVNSLSCNKPTEEQVEQWN